MGYLLQVSPGEESLRIVTILRKLQHQPRIPDHCSSELRKTEETTRNESITQVIKGHDGGCTIMRKGILRLTSKTRSEPTLRRFGVDSATQDYDHETIKDTGLQQNPTIQNLRENWKKSI